MPRCLAWRLRPPPTGAELTYRCDVRWWAVVLGQAVPDRSMGNGGCILLEISWCGVAWSNLEIPCSRVCVSLCLLDGSVQLNMNTISTPCLTWSAVETRIVSCPTKVVRSEPPSVDL